MPDNLFKATGQSPLGSFKATGRPIPLDFTPQVAPSFMDYVIEGAGSTLSTALDYADRLTGNPIRGLLAGKPEALLGMIPFIETITGEPVTRVGGRDLLESWGVLSQNQEGLDFGDVAGVVAEIGLDPLAWVGVAELSALGRATKTARGALTAQKSINKEISRNIDLSSILKRQIKTTEQIGERFKAGTGRTLDVGKLPEKGFDQRKLFRLRGFDKSFGPEVTLPAWMRGQAKWMDKFKFLPKSEAATAIHDASRMVRAIRIDKQSQLIAKAKGIATDLGLDNSEVANYIENIMIHPEKGIYEVLDDINQELVDLHGMLGDRVKVKDLHPDIQRLIKSGQKTISVDKLTDNVGILMDAKYEIAETLKDFDPGLIDALKSIQSQLNKDLKRNFGAGIPESYLRNPLQGYLSHQISDEGLKFLRSNEAIQREFFGEATNLSTASVFTKQRKLKGSIADINKMADGMGYSGASPFMWDDPWVAMGTRGRALSDSAYKGSYFKNVLAQFGVKGGEVPLAKILNHLKLTSYGKAHWRKDAGIDTIRKALTGAGEDNTLGLTREMFKDAARPFEFIEIGENWKGFFNKLDGWQSYYRGLVTAPWPAYHARNFMSNMWNSTVIGGNKSGGSFIKAAKLQRAMAAGKKLSRQDKRLWDDAVATGVIRPNVFEEIKDYFHLERSFEGNRLDKRLVNYGMHKGMAIENNARFAHFIGMKQQGMSGVEAAASVRKYLFNYNELSAFEKTFMRRGAFFYTWTRKNTPLMLETILRPQSRAYMALAGQGGGKPEDMPQWAWDAKMIQLGMDDDTGIMRALNLGLPIQDPFQSFGSLRKTASLASPFLKTPVELVTGTDLFSGQKIKDRDKSLGSIDAAMWISKLPSRGKDNPVSKFMENLLGYREEGGYSRINPYIGYALTRSPFSRFATLGGSEKSLPQFLATQAGFKTLDVRPEAQTDQARRMIERLKLRGELYSFDLLAGNTPRAKALARSVNR